MLSATPSSSVSADRRRQWRTVADGAASISLDTTGLVDDAAVWLVAEPSGTQVRVPDAVLDLATDCATEPEPTEEPTEPQKPGKGHSGEHPGQGEPGRGAWKHGSERAHQVLSRLFG